MGQGMYAFGYAMNFVSLQVNLMHQAPHNCESTFF